jgi:hypothetical protein
MLLAPSAYHRLRFREGDKDVLVRKGNREAIAGTAHIGRAQPTGFGRQQPFEPGSLSREQRPCRPLVHPPLLGSG